MVQDNRAGITSKIIQQIMDRDMNHGIIKIGKIIIMDRDILNGIIKIGKLIIMGRDILNGIINLIDQGLDVGIVEITIILPLVVRYLGINVQFAGSWGIEVKFVV